jgi:hypothetical protein
VVRRARVLRGDSAALRLAVAEVRVLAKLERFAEARALADSLLAAPHAEGDVERLAVLAALTGRAERAAALSRRAARARHGDPALPDSVADATLREAAAAYRTFAAVGAPPESVLATRARVAALVATRLAPDRRPAAREALLAQPAPLAWLAVGAPALAGLEADGGYHVALARAAARGDRAAVREGFRALRQARGAETRGLPTTFDAALVEATLHLWLGDTTAAAATLDGPLDVLAHQSTLLLDDVVQSAALPRAMALRAELARRAGDAALAGRWTRGATALLGGASVPRAGAAAGAH